MREDARGAHVIAEHITRRGDARRQREVIDERARVRGVGKPVLDAPVEMRRGTDGHLNHAVVRGDIRSRTMISEAVSPAAAPNR